MSNTDNNTTFSIKIIPKDCNICYDKKRFFITTPCNHEMCNDCYKQIINTNKCPFCRGILNENINKKNIIPLLNDFLNFLYNNKIENIIVITSETTISIFILILGQYYNIPPYITCCTQLICSLSTSYLLSQIL